MAEQDELKSFEHKPSKLIVNGPYGEPRRYRRYVRDSGGFQLVKGERRPAGFFVSSGSGGHDDPGVFVPLPLVNEIRERVAAWRKAGRPGVTAVTRELLDHWTDPDTFKDRRFFFCQLEAVETLIWLLEAPASSREGIEIPGDGGAFTRLCTKLATGTGKTLVMAMLIAWHVTNAATYPHDDRFRRHFLVVAPGITVRNRLAVLIPDSHENYYKAFALIPQGLDDALRQARIRIINWHKLAWDTDEQISKRRSVDKRGAKSDEAYVRDVLGQDHAARDWLVVNDEAHHAWRVPPGDKAKGISKAEQDEATKWIGGLDRIHRARGIRVCHDFSATPFTPGTRSPDESLFGWIVSDFGLNDAIESGLVKTPRVVIRDDGQLTKEHKSRFYHLYAQPDVRDDFNRGAEPHEPLPDIVKQGYNLLGKDWLKTREEWHEGGAKVPPVMITVANRAETAARVKYAFDHGNILIDELCDPSRTLHIDSKVLGKAEAQEVTPDLPDAAADAEMDDAGESGNEGDSDSAESNGRKLTKDQQAERLRRMVDTVGQVGKSGERIQNVISVAMLSEGWDAKTVTHIMGLRAFTSQLLCEQVVGRGLRRTAYDLEANGMFKPEYVNIFGVPFSFLPHEEDDNGTPPPPTKPTTTIDVVPEREAQFALSWPNIVRIDHVYEPQLTVDLDAVEPLEIDTAGLVMRAELASLLEGKPDWRQLSEIDLADLARRFRLQWLVFKVAQEVFDQVRPGWPGQREWLLAQVVRIVERFLASDRIRFIPELFVRHEPKRRIALALSMTRIVQHLWEAIRHENAHSRQIVFDRNRPQRSTSDMRPWATTRPTYPTKRSHINFAVVDSTWETSEAFTIDDHKAVGAWAKTDRLGFEIHYLHNGVHRRYRPDFLVRLVNGTMLVLEVKGQETDESKAKHAAAEEWVEAVNAHGGFGRWAFAVSRHIKDVGALLEDHAQ